MLLFFITNINRPDNYNTFEAGPLVHIEDYNYMRIIKTYLIARKIIIKVHNFTFIHICVFAQTVLQLYHGAQYTP